MSRRLRIEEEKMRQLKDDIQEEEDKIKLMKEKIFGPLTWRLLQNGIRIQDLQAKYYQDTIDMILEYYIIEDVLFRNTNIRYDEDSKKSLSERILFKLHDHASIVALDENNNDTVAGVLILTPVVKADFGRVYSRAMVVEGKPYQAVLDFVNHVNRKVDLYEQFQCNIYMRYYLLCIHPEYRRKGLGFQMMSVGLDIARHLNIPIIMGIFNNYKMQKLARRLGMETVYELPYVKWADRTGELVFCDPGAGNYTCAAMAGAVPPPPEPEKEAAARRAAAAAAAAATGPAEKRTRADKRKLKAKGKK